MSAYTTSMFLRGANRAYRDRQTGINVMHLGIVPFLLFVICMHNNPGINSQNLELVRAAQRANPVRYPSGEIRATFRTGQSAPIEIHEYHECRVRWLEDKIWTRVESWPVKSRREPNTDKEPGTVLYYIVDRGKLMVYHPAGNIVVISAINNNDELPLEAKLIPRRSWYSPLGKEAFSWCAILGATQPAESAVTARYELETLPDQQVEVRISDPGISTTVRMVFSWEYNCNLTVFKATDPTSGDSQLTRCEWSRDGESVYLKSIVTEEDAHVRDTFVQTYKELSIESFDPAKLIKESAFGLDALKLPAGVLIQDKVAGRTYRIGDVSATKSAVEIEKLLEPLILELQTKGFSAK